MCNGSLVFITLLYFSKSEMNILRVHGALLLLSFLKSIRIKYMVLGKSLLVIALHSSIGFRK